MGELYRFLSHVVVGFVVIVFYFKLTPKRKIGFKHMIVILLYAFFMMWAHNTIIEPFRTLLGLFILSICLINKEERINFSGLLIPFLLLPLVRTLLAFIIGFVTYIFFSENLEFEIVQLLIIFPTEALTFILLCHSIKTEKIKEALDGKEIRIIIYASSILIWIIYGIVHTLAVFNGNITQAVTLTLMSILIPGGFTSIVVIIYAVKKYHEKRALEKTVNHQLKVIDDLTSLTHSYKNGVKLMAYLLKELDLQIESDGKVTGGGYLQDLSSLVESFESLTTNLNQEFVYEELQKYVSILDFPKEWWSLQLTLAGFMLQGHKSGILLEIKNEYKDWGSLKVSQFDVSKIVENLMSNAIKELSSADMIGKMALVVFYQNDAGYFTFEIVDNAHEFSIDVLKRLGKRKNSTHGSGDGYAEIFELLNKLGASFLIEESNVMGYFHKKINIIFDDRRKKKIQSSYRNQNLYEALTN